MKKKIIKFIIVLPCIIFFLIILLPTGVLYVKNGEVEDGVYLFNPRKAHRGIKVGKDIEPGLYTEKSTKSSVNIELEEGDVLIYDVDDINVFYHNYVEFVKQDDYVQYNPDNGKNGVYEGGVSIKPGIYKMKGKASGSYATIDYAPSVNGTFDVQDIRNEEE